MEPQGRHRYYRLAGPQVGQLIEAVTQLAPAQPIRSLRQGTRAHALRQARTCYDHLAGRLGVAIMRALLDGGYLIGGDGDFHAERAVRDQRAGYGHDVDYHFTADGDAFLTDLGVVLPSRRPVVRYCVDWSEQCHHLSGAIGRNLLNRLVELGWIHRSPSNRAVHITDAGHASLAAAFRIQL